MSNKTRRKQHSPNKTASISTKKRLRAPWDTNENDSFGRLLFGIIVNPLTLGVVALIVACIIWLGPKDTKITILDRTWARNISVEDWRNVLGEGWDYPAGAEVTSKERKFYKYVKVEDSSDSLGYRYDEEYRYWYTYNIDKWVVVRTEIAEGGMNDTPYWPEVTLTGQEREAEREEKYYILCKDEEHEEPFQLYLPQSSWVEMEPGEDVDIEYWGSEVTKINGNTLK